MRNCKGIATIAMCVHLLALAAHADTWTDGAGYTWSYAISGGAATITGVSPAQGDIAIPSTLGGKPVTNIGSSAFFDCSGLTSVTIPNSVTSIGSSAFRGCSGLTSVTIPNSVTNIGNYAFHGCSGLTSVHIADLAKWCGISFGNTEANPLCCAHDLYLNDVKVTALTIPNGVTTIGSSAFSGCSGLTSVTIPDSVTSIGNFAFYGCSGLTSVYITDLAKWCGISFGSPEANPLCYVHNLYLNGVNVTALTIPSSVTNIGSYAFSGCSGLTSVTIPNSVTNIGSGAFYVCSGLTSVTIPDSVTSIGNYAFYKCSGLTSVTIPNSVTSIGSSAFSGCSGLTSATIPNSVTSIGSSAFSGCSGLTSVTIPNSVTTIESYAFSGCSGLTSVTISDGVTGIDYGAFFGCSELASVIIPKSVTSIAEPYWYSFEGSDRWIPGAFDGCSGLTSVTIPSCWVLSAIFPDSYSRISSVTIPSGSTAIADYAFKGCGSLTSISIPDSVTSIGDEAFYNCASLENLAIPDSVTDYGVNCFEGCPAYTRQLYRAVFGGNAGGGSATVVTTVVQNVEAPYALADHVADRAIASVTVNGDCSIDSFVLKDGKVYDSMLYVSNTADHVVALSLPSGFTYKTIKGATPLAIPASSQCLISITRVDANVFLVMREELDDVK